MTIIGAASSYSLLVIGAAVTALVGGLLSLFWDVIKRNRESDFKSREAFYDAYAEFFTTWKLWDAYIGHSVIAPDDVQWQLLHKAETAEASFEALLVRLTAEQRLSPTECNHLAAFRQGYQVLREKIRANERLNWWSSDGATEYETQPQYREYRAFKALASYFAALLVRRHQRLGAFMPRRQPTTNEAIGALLLATRSRRDWAEAGDQLITSSGDLPLTTF